MTCQVTVYDQIPPRPNARGRGETSIHPRPCGHVVTRFGLCDHHAAEKERLS